MRVLPLLVTAVTLVACGGASSRPDATTVSSTATAPSASAPQRTLTATTTKAPAPSEAERSATANGGPTGGTPRETGVVTKVVDGDTIWVAGAGKVRLVGMDTPERGQCGFEQATDHLEALLMGREVTLSYDGRDDRDRYGRLLRYVDVDGVDAGLAQIRAGLARARYDSRDGYGAHPREATYLAADATSPALC